MLLAAGSSVNSAALIAGLTAIGTLLITLGTIALWRLTQRSQRQHEVEQLVNAQISGHFHQILDLSDRAQRTFARAETLQATVEADHDQIAKDRDEVRTMLEELTQLRDRWGRLVPTMEAIEESPELLRITASERLEEARGSGDPDVIGSGMRDATAFLRRLLQHPDAESRDLELGGDLAREFLLSLSLARELYQRAVDADPANFSALAELCALRARHPLEREEAVEELSQLIQDHPEVSTARINLFNHFIDADRWTDLAASARRLLEVDASDSSAWRNLGVALFRLGDVPESRAAYERAIELARASNSDDAFVNAVRGYVGLLFKTASQADLQHSMDLLNEAIQRMPLEATIHIARGDAQEKLGQMREARRSYTVGSQLGSPVEARAADQRLRGLEILSALNLAKEDEGNTV